ncbi:carbohydrate kinase family protein [Georgenia sp. AZ-5]|uniref:carbohydrate kinase family protein n=1 Tax=Georgenia sp. AZ-5 TaxID=3367526 RepID=UPI0037551217
MSGRIGVVGDVAFDYVIDLDEADAPDEKVIPRATARLLGGTGANAAAVATTLGSQVSLHANVGDDPTGDWVRRALTERGIDTTHVAVSPGTTATATILRRGTGRTVIVDIGVGLSPLANAPTAVADLRACDLIYVSYSPEAVTRLIREGLGDRLVAGLEGWMLADNDFLHALARCRLVITNDAGYAALTATGSVPQAPVVRTQGEKGASIHHPDGTTVLIPPFIVDAVDATGAGDCFAGTLCHYVAQGTPLADAAHLASASAALSTTAVGAQGRIPSPNELESLAAVPDRDKRENGSVPLER